jgi:thiosulfate/3-mercaptopyruvate sulfurtransferase
MSYQTLISVEELQSLQRSARPALLFDARFDLADPAAGERDYTEKHLPAAQYLHLDRDLSSAKTGSNGRHPLPERAGFAQLMAAKGLSAGRQVVIYDAQAGMVAARLWWMLRWIGHADVAVLDGGLQSWAATAGTLESTAVLAPEPGDFVLSSALTRQIDADSLQSKLGQVRLIDARAGERFRGEVEPLDAQAGHIPGARNRFFKDNLQADGRFKPAEQLRQEFEALLAPFGEGAVVQQCGSGVTACHNLLAMAHAGLGESSLYPGSWSEWSANPARPLAVGG